MDGLSYEERSAGAQSGSLYLISMVVVFLCLAALYESWAVPFSVMMAVPLGAFGAVAATWGRGLSNDVFLQVGILTIVGLSAKNAISSSSSPRRISTKAWISFPRRSRRREAAPAPDPHDVAGLRTGRGAPGDFDWRGSGGQNAIGTGVIGGTAAATILGIFLIPLFFVVVLRLFRTRPRNLSGGNLTRLL